MWQNIALEKCISFVESELQPKKKFGSAPASIRPAITISRMMGAVRLVGSLEKRIEEGFPESGL